MGRCSWAQSGCADRGAVATDNTAGGMNVQKRTHELLWACRSHQVYKCSRRAYQQAKGHLDQLDVVDDVSSDQLTSTPASTLMVPGE